MPKIYRYPPLTIGSNVCWKERFINMSNTRSFHYQATSGNDQIASPTNQKTAGSKLKRTS